jgi:hypothetical protein
MDYHKQLAGLGDEQVTLTKPVRIEAKRKKHLGPTGSYAKVTLYAEPAPEFLVVDLVSADSEVRIFGYPSKFIDGLLQVLLSDERHPLTRLRVTLESADYSEIDSTPLAFFEAGRIAGNQLLALQATGH